MDGRERLALVAHVILPVVPLVASLARVWEVASGSGPDPSLVPPFWPVPLFTRVGVAAAVALMCSGPTWRWASSSPGSVVAFAPRLVVFVSVAVVLQVAVAP